MKKWVYYFHEGNAGMRNLLGGKGAGLAEMTNLGLPIPQGFTITTEACTEYYARNREIPMDIQEQIFEALRWLEEKQGKKFGDVNNPLLVSVRSGARASMPGMMDTILNLGLNDISVEGFAKKTGNPRFAYDSYRRFIQMFSDVVMEVSKSLFEKEIDAIKEKKGIKYDVDMTAEDLQELIKRFKKIYKDAMGEDFPQDPKTQLIEAVRAVFRSWDNERAIIYRRMNDIPGDWGTAVNVQSMVFGNMGDKSGTGVAFTRNPATGEMEALEAYPLERVEEVMRTNDIRMPDKFLYTIWYLFNMAAADYQKTCRTDEDRIMFAKETLCDPDGCPENVLDCFEVKMRNAGVPIFWERML